jgi:hypothetical protein
MLLVCIILNVPKQRFVKARPQPYDPLSARKATSQLVGTVGRVEQGLRKASPLARPPHAYFKRANGEYVCGVAADHTALRVVQS